MTVSLRCPLCQTPLHARAIVDAFNDPPAWTFWGEAGQRWKACEGDGVIHFRVVINGRSNHRLAVIRHGGLIDNGDVANRSMGDCVPDSQRVEREPADWLA